MISPLQQNKLKDVFEMAAMPFPCNGHLLCCVNIPTVLLMFFNKFASCPIPYFNSNSFSIENGLALALNSFSMFSFIVSQIVFDFFINQLGYF